MEAIRVSEYSLRNARVTLVLISSILVSCSSNEESGVRYGSLPNVRSSNADLPEQSASATTATLDSGLRLDASVINASYGPALVATLSNGTSEDVNYPSRMYIQEKVNGAWVDLMIVSLEGGGAPIEPCGLDGEGCEFAPIDAIVKAGVSLTLQEISLVNLDGGPFRVTMEPTLELSSSEFSP